MLPRLLLIAPLGQSGDARLHPTLTTPLSPPRPPPFAGTLRLRNDMAVRRARNEHPALMMLLESRFDHGCKLAAEMYEHAAALWGAPGNVTFARVDIEESPSIAADLGIRSVEDHKSLPRHGLFLEGIASPIRYSGGWSEPSLSAWLRRQLALAPVEVHSLLDLGHLARRNPHGLVVVGLLTESQRARRLLENAARVSEVHATVAHGDERLAAEMGLDSPCIAVISANPEDAWAALRPPLTQQAVEGFLMRHALPLVVPMGDGYRTFSRHVREHPLKLQVILVHRSGARGRDDESDYALAAVRRSAAALQGKVLFISYDFFDNDPQQFVSYGVYGTELPALRVIHSRGGVDERWWESSAGTEVNEDSITTLVERAMRELGSAAQRDMNAGRGTTSYSQAPPTGYAAAMEQCKATSERRDAI